MDPKACYFTTAVQLQFLQVMQIVSTISAWIFKPKQSLKYGNASTGVDASGAKRMFLLIINLLLEYENLADCAFFGRCFSGHAVYVKVKTNAATTLHNLSAAPNLECLVEVHNFRIKLSVLDESFIHLGRMICHPESMVVVTRLRWWCLSAATLFYEHSTFNITISLKL